MAGYEQDELRMQKSQTSMVTTTVVKYRYE
jgi:hypothetical protein